MRLLFDVHYLYFTPSRRSSDLGPSRDTPIVRAVLRDHTRAPNGGTRHMNRKGFTLIELLIVVVIIGILAAIAIPKFANTKGKAYIASMKSDLRNLVTAEEAYFADSVKYSTNVTSKVGGVACTPVAGQVSWCPTTGNNLVTINAAGGGWDASMTNNNLTGAA